MVFVNQFPRNKDLPYSDPIGALGAAQGAGKEAGRENGTNPAGGRRRPTLPYPRKDATTCAAHRRPRARS